MLVEAGCESLDVAQSHFVGESPAGVLTRLVGGVVGLHLLAPPAAGVDAFVSSVEDLGRTLPGLGGAIASTPTGVPSTP